MYAAAIARTNIALIKYWGKRNETLNLPAVGSISITLRDLWTKTAVEFGSQYRQDLLQLNGEMQNGFQVQRISRFLDLVRTETNSSLRAKVVSENNFPTKAGLASSASGFAAITLAAAKALNLNLSPEKLSILARQGSGSAARSLFGGFVEMKAGIKEDGSDSFAVQLADENYWSLNVFIAITSENEKKVGSTTGMKRSAVTSPFYQGWVSSSKQDLQELRNAIVHKDLEKLGNITEHNCLKMHALAMSSVPSLFYWNSATVETIQRVNQLRKKGVPVFFTIDAGPQVKLICEPGYSSKVEQELQNINGIIRTILTPLGPNAEIIEEIH